MSVHRKSLGVIIRRLHCPVLRALPFTNHSKTLPFRLKNLPALVLKIMSGTFAPISDRYSPELRQLILNMLNLDPSKRPQLNEIMALPICIRPLLNLYTDIGSVKMRR